jgi:hypothetical protein
VPFDKHKAIHRATSRDSLREAPKFEMRRTDSIEWHEYRNNTKSYEGSSM